ncbi:photoactive yellow protein [Acidisphaera sp. L21]|uniref:photoactive yellow protein n=1 Tax=Acidisphaera sp. L21 TaxID=1641851 RepID=UPI001C20920E|nr:photoactive yellow protein [Acidisphaera sp. L21]
MDLMTRIEFGQDHVENDLALMTPSAIDQLAFGAIQLNAAGLVLGYNATESTITGRRKEAVIGRNFFNEIAPCCNKPAFRGVFDAGVKAGNLNAMFDYTFDYKMNPTRVKVHMKKAVADDTYWVFVKRL